MFQSARGFQLVEQIYQGCWPRKVRGSEKRSQVLNDFRVRDFPTKLLGKWGRHLSGQRHLSGDKFGKQTQFVAFLDKECVQNSGPEGEQRVDQ